MEKACIQATLLCLFFMGVHWTDPAYRVVLWMWGGLIAINVVVFVWARRCRIRDEKRGEKWD
jgi:hypothetical protein